MKQPVLVDMHGHLFNAGHVPISGVLQRFGVPSAIADKIERHIHRRLTGPQAESGDELPDFGSFTDDEILAWLAQGSELEELSTGEDMALTGIESIKDLIESAARSVEKAKAFKRWLAIMMLPESQIALMYREVAHGRILLVHHMMDMDNYYPGRSDNRREPFYGSPTKRLERLAGITPDPELQLQVFFAYDPLRPNGVRLAQTAVEEGGAAGIKFYPPNGYSAVDNPNHQMDKANLELFRWAVKNDVPILAHCTRAGFESRPEIGRRSDPLHWRRVLETKGLEGLRLCLGHAGGAEEWCGSELGPYARTVLELCTTYDNVYCEFGHFEEALDETPARNIAKNLDLVGLDLANEPTKFGSRIMFGSDWHISAAVHAELGGYVDAFRAIFQGRLKPLEEGFFVGNALRFLKVHI